MISRTRAIAGRRERREVFDKPVIESDTSTCLISPNARKEFIIVYVADPCYFVDLVRGKKRIPCP